jgi:hypothetical protein
MPTQQSGPRALSAAREGLCTFFEILVDGWMHGNCLLTSLNNAARGDCGGVRGEARGNESDG